MFVRQKYLPPNEDEDVLIWINPGSIQMVKTIKGNTVLFVAGQKVSVEESFDAIIEKLGGKNGRST